MRKPIPACAAAVLSIATPAQAQVTNYSVTGDHASGTFALNYDGSNYSLNSADLRVGTWFTTSNASVAPNKAGLQIGGDAGGGALNFTDTEPDFAIGFLPDLTSQTDNILYALGGDQFGFVTLTQTGTSGSVTNYSVTGDQISGTFSLDFDGTNYSLSALDLFLGTQFTTVNTALAPNKAGLQIGGDAGGGALNFTDTEPDFAIGFLPDLTSQTDNLLFAQGGDQFALVTVDQVPPPGVPEPSTWAMMLLGFGAIGVSVRHRRRREIARFAGA